MIQTGAPYFGAPILPAMLVGRFADIDRNNSNALPGTWKDIEPKVKTSEFRGILEIPGAPFTIPRQNFIATFTSDGSIIFENCAISPWPRILIELAIEPTDGRANVKSFRIRPIDNSTDAEIVYTRVQFEMGKIGRCARRFGDGEDNLPFKFDPPTPSDEKQLLHRAKIFRKLQYIERVFDTRFSLPKEISRDDVAAIEFVFRAITEGEFSTRQQQITLPLDPSKVDLTKPPFDGPGPLIYREDMDWIELFGQRLPIGNPVVTLRHAEVASPQAVRQIRQGHSGPVWVRFDILDHQIHYQFGNRTTRSAKRLQQQGLKSFKQELAKNESMELTNLLDETLMADVSGEEAGLIAMGWTQYNNLPDRFCPQAPILAQDTNCWHVPIYLAYTSGKVEPVGELVIDKKTGEIISHTPIEELQSKGMDLRDPNALAKAMAELLNRTPEEIEQARERLLRASRPPFV